MHVCTNGILWMASCFFALFGTLQQILLAQFCFCARKWVWFDSHGGGCGRLWWNVLKRSSLGLPIRLPKELSMCGATTNWLLLVLSACTCACSRLALHMLGVWCLSWKKSWRETSGMWHMKGGLFQMRRASKSWRSALQSFVLRPRFGRMECTSGRQMMYGATYTKEVKEPQWQASGFMVCTRHKIKLWYLKPFCIFGLNCLLAGRSDACGVCACGTTGALHLWT